MYIPLPRIGALWIEPRHSNHAFYLEKDRGEWLLWFRSWHLIFTPIGWKPSFKAVRKAFSHEEHREAVQHARLNHRTTNQV